MTLRGGVAGAPTLRDLAALARHDGAVIVEHALLDVRPGSEGDFEAAFASARDIIGAMPGFRSLRLARCLERPNRYLLLVEWERLEDHTVSFRQSPEYERWRTLLHHFYEPFPTVEHYETRSAVP
jgi:heme-degrading monooxygenase HmoA